MAAKKILTPYDFQQNEVQNARIQNLASDPGSPVEGQVWWNTTSHTGRVKNNSGNFDLLDGGAVAQTKTGQLTLSGGLVVNTTGITGNKEINLTGTGASSVGGNFTGVILVASGNTGATAASRYAGATASAAPASGTYATGDFVVSQTGDLYVCTSGGTPGTWVRVGSYLLAANNTWTGTNTFNNTVNGSGAISTTSTHQGTQFTATGQTGAATSTKYAGGNSSGAPGSGTFATGDWTVTTGGDIYVCSSGGTPGTWVRVGSYLLGATNSWTAANTFTGGVVVNTVGITGNKEINLTGTGASSVAGTMSATQYTATGQTGATTSTKYAGGTASVAPASGTFATGDWVVAANGNVFVCTSGGTPGTWVQVGSYLLAATNSWSGANTFTGGVVVNTVGITGNKEINLTGTGTSSVGGTFTATALIPSGLTGATTATRFVGGTASIAPTTGSFNTGDFVITQTGAIYICTAGGSPGTWSAVSGGGGYNLVKANGSSITARTTLNFINGTYTTATAVDNASQSDIKFEVVPGNITPNLLGAATADWSNNSKRITNLLDPSSAQDAATKNYVDLAIQGLDWKNSVRVVATTNGALATAYANGQVVDGQTLATGDRILLAGQTTGSENGIYIVAASGAPTRATDADANAEISRGTVVPVEAGTANANTFYYCTATGATPWVPGSSTSTWSYMFTVSATQAGAGLTASSNVLNVGTNPNNTIVVNADDITVNRTGTSGSHVAVIFTTATHASTTAIAITHSLGNQWVVAQVFDVASGAQVDCDVVLTSSSVTTFNFAVAPSANSLRFVIWG
ncbi:MAG TPA: hypothetical protein VFL67_18870 [Mycobacterium sp.]|nr:hypothetical protein [Mycobacterium sp.]